MSIQCSDPNGSALWTQTGFTTITLPRELNNATITDVQAGLTTASSSGSVTISVARIRGGTPTTLTSTVVTLSATKTDSYTDTPPTLNPSATTIATGDQLRIDVTGAGTGAKGLQLFVTIDVP